jgi:hypothetical protein
MFVCPHTALVGCMDNKDEILRVVLANHIVVNLSWYTFLLPHQHNKHILLVFYACLLLAFC